MRLFEVLTYQVCPTQQALEAILHWKRIRWWLQACLGLSTNEHSFVTLHAVFRTGTQNISNSSAMGHPGTFDERGLFTRLFPNGFSGGPTRPKFLRNPETPRK